VVEPTNAWLAFRLQEHELRVELGEEKEHGIRIKVNE